MRYWVYINDQVSDVPYTKEELSSLPGMTAQTLICAENAASGQEPQWVEASTVLGPYGAPAAEPAPAPQSAPYPYDNRAYQTQYAPQQQYQQQYPQPQYQQYPQYTQFSGMPFGQQTQYNPYYQGPQQAYPRQNPFAAQQFAPQQNPSAAPQPAAQPAPQQDQQVLLLDQLGALTKELQSMRKELAALQDENASLRDELSGKEQYRSPKKYSQRPEDLAKENMPKPFMMDEDTSIDLSVVGNKKKNFYGGEGEEDTSAPVPVELSPEAEAPTISETVEDIDMDKVEEDISEEDSNSENIIENAINTTIMNRNHFSVTKRKSGGNIVDLTGRFDKKEKSSPKKIQQDEDVIVEEIEETPVPVRLEKYKGGKKIVEEEIIEESEVPEGEIIEEEIVDESEVPEGQIIEEVQEVSEEKMPSAQTIEEEKVEENLYTKEQGHQKTKDSQKGKHLGDYGKHKEEAPQEITSKKLTEEPFSAEKAPEKEEELKSPADKDKKDKSEESSAPEEEAAQETKEEVDLTDIPREIPPAEEIKEEEIPVSVPEEEKSSKEGSASVSEEEDNSEIEKSESAEEVSVLEEFAADKETSPKEEEYPELEEPAVTEDKASAEKKEETKPAEAKSEPAPEPKKEKPLAQEKKEEAKPAPQKEEKKEEKEDERFEMRGAIPDKIPSLKEEGIKSFAELEASDEIDEKALAEAQEIDDKFLKTFTTNIEEVFLDQPTSIISDYVPPAVADDDYVVASNGAQMDNQEGAVAKPQEIIDIKANPQAAQNDAQEDMRNVRRIKPAAIKTVPMVPGATGEVPLSNVPNIEEAIAELHGKTSVFKILKMFSAVFALIIVALLFVAFLSTMGIMPATKSPIHMIVAKITGKKITEKASSAADASEQKKENASAQTSAAAASVQQVSSSTAAAGEQNAPVTMDRSLVLKNVKAYDLGGGLTLEKKISLIYPKERPMWVVDQGFNPEDFSVAAKMPENNEGYSQVYRFNYNTKDSQLIPTTTEARNIISMPVEELQKLAGPKKFSKTPLKKGKQQESQSIVKVE